MIAALAHLAASNPLSSAFQALLDFLGAVLAFFYQIIPNYGVAIILLTLAIRVLLLPLAVKQIRSMQAMQAVQPKVKELQKKYKGNRQKLNEEMMALYREHGVNPLSGCFPLLAQFPVLIALFAVLQFPRGLTHIPHSDANPVVGTSQDSRLYVDIINQRTKFLGANLVCSASQAGKQVTVDASQAVPDAPRRLDCGSGIPARIPYYVFALLMIGTTYFQQRQMQRASPAGAQQQQMLTRIMPLLFGFWGFIFPAGLVVYWTTTNAVQIGQQYLMFSRGLMGAGAGAGAGTPPSRASSATDGGRGSGPRRGPGAGTVGRAGTTRRPAAGGNRPGDRRSTDRRSGTGKGAEGRSGGGRQAGDGKAGGAGRPGRPGSGQRRPGSSGSRAGGPGASSEGSDSGSGGSGSGGSGPGGPGSVGPSTRSSAGSSGATPAGGSNAGDRKKRRKR